MHFNAGASTTPPPPPLPQLDPDVCVLMQGDVLCAEALHQILVTREGQSRLLAAFIHRVVPLYQTVSTLRTPRSNKTSWLATWRDRNIFLHRTHVGMAVQVFNGLILPPVPSPPPPLKQTYVYLWLLHCTCWHEVQVCDAPLSPTNAPPLKLPHALVNTSTRLLLAVHSL